jgi:hypothetical protein
MTHPPSSMIIVMDQMPYCSCPARQCLNILPGIDTIDLSPATDNIPMMSLLTLGAFKNFSDIGVMVLRNVFFGSIVIFLTHFRA